MKKKDVSRRDFLKYNALAGTGLLMSQMYSSRLFASGSFAAGHEPVMYFDAYTQIGPYKYKHPAAQWKLEELISEIDFCSVSGALVSYTLSVSYDAMYSNIELSKMLEPHKHLFAVWNVMPANTDEFPSGEKLGKLMAEYDVRAVTINPATNAWNWKMSYNQDLLQWLSEKKILTIIDYTEFSKWEELDTFLETFPGLPVLVRGIWWDQQRYLIPSMIKHKNLHCTFSHLQNMYGIEYMCKKGLENQMLFGSNAPTMSAGAHRTFIDYADIPEAARKKIAGGNLARLLKGQGPKEMRENKSEDIFMKAVRQGKMIPADILDTHMHVLQEGMNGAGWAYVMEKGDPRGVLELTGRMGYTGGGFMSWNGVVSSDSAKGNISTKQCLDVCPEGYWGLANFDTVHYSQEELKQMIPALYESDQRFIGMKPYHYIGVSYDDPSWDVWWKYGNEHKLYGLLHSTRSDMREYTTLAKKYPDCRWLVAHAGGSFGYAATSAAAARQYPNIYLDITLTPVPLGMIEFLVKEAGENKVCYGSDLPMRDPRPQFGWVVFSRLSVEQKRKVLAHNAYEMIKPCIDRLPQKNRPKMRYPL